MSKENKKTAVKIFVKLFNDIKDVKPERVVEKRNEFVAKYISNTYMPYALKMAEAKKIVDKSCNLEVNGKSVFNMSSPMRWVLFVVSVVNYYTSLEFAGDVMEDFDLLNCAGAIEYIFGQLKDVDEFQTVLNMTTDDYMNNDRDIVTFLEDKFAALGMLLESVDVDAIEGALKDNN